MNFFELNDYRFDNFSKSEITRLLDLSAVKELPEIHLEAVSNIISAFLIGNINDTLDEIRALDIDDRNRVLSWCVDCFNDLDSLKRFTNMFLLKT